MTTTEPSHVLATPPVVILPLDIPQSLVSPFDQAPISPNNNQPTNPSNNTEDDSPAKAQNMMMANKNDKVTLPADHSVSKTLSKVSKLKGGLCWQDAFIDPTPKMKWVTVGDMKYFSNTYRLSDERFKLFMIVPGAYHMEWTEDETQWTIKDIFKLPNQTLIGGSSSEERALQSDGMVKDVVFSTNDSKGDFQTTPKSLDD